MNRLMTLMFAAIEIVRSAGSAALRIVGMTAPIAFDSRRRVVNDRWLAAAASFGLALLAGCDSMHPRSERCQEACFNLAPESELIPIKSGSTPVFAVAGSIVVESPPGHAGSAPASGETDWSSAYVQTILDGIASGLRRTAGVETVVRPTAALSIARLTIDQKSALPRPNQQDDALEPALPDKLLAPMLGAPIWGERATHLVLFDASIDKSAMQYKLGIVGGATGVAPSLATSRDYSLRLRARTYDRATGQSVSSVSIEDSTTTQVLWVIFIPIPGAQASVNQVFQEMSQRVGEEFGRRFRVTGAP